ncbi:MULTISPECIES: (2Fe-2S) ferredoxin domain-containing protein [Paraburkholderia]|uniref:(2Fe-2S) ferredoxin n=1 Tax=Paraburkholderia bannensis TaxID=765414 RepID=A0A7W9WUS7_9BURK|nr:MULTISPECIES: NAD(P)H-dependent oxidoreductase subunit E [Paraburkholderia]MBB3261775.1 (2Fe-2S) ferredoxin [Paraburkholderia sp. WP4_3_2]MBB6106725.1 (2Fe-2S) ferredoxin [Paraburkholderia bannensis]
MSFYDRHVFVCTNGRENGEACNDHGASEICQYAKKRLAEAVSQHAPRIRINRAGCFARCSDGPIVVIYPEAVWYTYVDKTDIDEIVDEHLVNGRVVERLRIDP